MILTNMMVRRGTAARSDLLLEKALRAQTITGTWNYLPREGMCVSGYRLSTKKTHSKSGYMGASDLGACRISRGPNGSFGMRHQGSTAEISRADP